MPDAITQIRELQKQLERAYRDLAPFNDGFDVTATPLVLSFRSGEDVVRYLWQLKSDIAVKEKLTHDELVQLELLNKICNFAEMWTEKEPTSLR